MKKKGASARIEEMKTDHRDNSVFARRQTPSSDWTLEPILLNTFINNISKSKSTAH